MSTAMTDAIEITEAAPNGARDFDEEKHLKASIVEKVSISLDAGEETKEEERLNKLEAEERLNKLEAEERLNKLEAEEGKGSISVDAGEEIDEEQSLKISTTEEGSASVHEFNKQISFQNSFDRRGNDKVDLVMACRSEDSKNERSMQNNLSNEQTEPLGTTSRLTSQQPPVRLRRFASIDFLRGLAIVFMLVLHIIPDTLDIDHVLNNLGTVPLINIVALITIPFLGGLAGLFLLTSAIGNGIATRRNFTKGHAPMSIMIKQVIGGTILVCLAIFSEAFLCYHGAWGTIMKNLHQIPAMLTGKLKITSWRYQGYIFETLHTIGWCTLLNGVIQGMLLAICGKGQNRKESLMGKRSTSDLIPVFDRINIINWILVLGVLIITPFVWSALGRVVPGYPYATNEETGYPLFMPYTGKSPWVDYVFYFFVNPLAAPVEPILPYLATALMGSIVGYHLVELDEKNIALQKEHVQLHVDDCSVTNNISVKIRTAHDNFDNEATSATTPYVRLPLDDGRGSCHTSENPDVVSPSNLNKEAFHQDSSSIQINISSHCDENETKGNQHDDVFHVDDIPYPSSRHSSSCTFQQPYSSEPKCFFSSDEERPPSPGSPIIGPMMLKIIRQSVRENPNYVEQYRLSPSLVSDTDATASKDSIASIQNKNIDCQKVEDPQDDPPAPPVFAQDATLGTTSNLAEKQHLNAGATSPVGEESDTIENNVANQFVMKYLWISISICLVGITGLLILLARMGNLDSALNMYKQMYDHRAFTSENGIPGGWIFQYMALNGFGIMLTMITIRFVECRGHQNIATFGFANNVVVVFVRRFGFVALTIYVIQWIYQGLFFVVTAFYPQKDYYEPLPWAGTLIVIALNFIIMHILLRLWERVGYLGSMEWVIVFLANLLSPIPKQNGSSNNGSQRERQPWWRAGQLNVQGAFYDVDWIAFDYFYSDDQKGSESIVNSSSGIDHNAVLENEQCEIQIQKAASQIEPCSLQQKRLQNFLEREVSLVRKLSLLGIICWPFAIMSYRMCRELDKWRQSLKTDPTDPFSAIPLDVRHLMRSKFIAAFGILLLIVSFICLCLFSAQDIGINL